MDVRPDDGDIDALLGETIAKVGESPEVLLASAKLQAMIDAARGKPPELVDPRTLPVRFTRLKMFSLSAAHYLNSVQHELEETIALRMGAAVHSGLFLNRKVVCYDGRRQGKAWERFEKHHLELGAVILNEKEYRLATGVMDAVGRHDRAMEVLFDGATTEELIHWSIGDRACRSTPDSYSARRCVDLKSTRCGEPRWFAREALKRHYHAQLAFYDRALQHKTGHSGRELQIVAVENVEPFNVVVWRVSDAARQVAEKLITTWWEQLLLCEASQLYPGYVETDIDLDVPDFENVFTDEPPAAFVQ